MKVHHFLFSAICILLMVISCQKEPEVVKVESVSLNSTSMTLVEGDTQSLMATVSPSTATNKKVIWSSSNSSVATVDDRGTVTAIAPGTATITAKTDDGGKTATCTVTVNSKVISVESVSLDKTTAEITEGETITLTATVKPDNATNKKVTWSSSNEEIATVKDGVVSAVKEGEAIITAKTEDGGKTASCSVVVKEKVYPVESIELDKTTAELTEGETLTLTATIKPENATNKNVIWSSSNEEIATVEDGVVTAIKAGEATITAKTEDGGKTTTCDVKVNAKVYPVESVSLDKTTAELTEGETLTLTATVKPENATNKKVTWSSSNEEIATVKDGVVTAIKAGEVTITANTEDGGKTATCSVKVKAKVYPVESISLDKTSASLKVGETTTLTATINPNNASNKNVIWSSSNEEIAIVNDGLVTAIKVGEATITAKTEDGGKTATCAVTIKESRIDLSESALANCYIISEANKYEFRIPNEYLNANRAFLLWDENGGTDIINVCISDGYVCFEKPSFAKGNAVISIANGSTILWSWHIWSTDQPKYINNIMDRNLGATSAEPNNPDAYGLYYSYGCPFPFPGAKYENWVISDTPSVPSGWYVADGYGFYYSSDMPTAAHPMQYCTNEDKYGNSIYWRIGYSPCPPSNKMLSATSLQNLIGYEPSFVGQNGIKLSNNLFIPAAGSGRDCGRTISEIGTYGGYWGNSTYNYGAVDADACWFYEKFSKASLYYRGNTLHSIRTRK